MSDSTNIHAVDLTDLDVEAYWHSLRPSERFKFADEVYAFGTVEQANAIAQLVYPQRDVNDDPLEFFEGDQTSIFDELGGGS